MSRFIGPRLKIVRRLGDLPGVTVKSSKRKGPPGQHGNPDLKGKRKKTMSQYHSRLVEKQKVKYHYGLTERQLLNSIRKARKINGSTGKVLLQSLEMRLDCIIFRLGLAPTIFAARQIVNHGHILVNKKSVNIPSYECQLEDSIEVKNSKAAKNLWEGSDLSSFRTENLKNLINSDNTSLNVDERLIVEYYSRKI
jgi:small subunit ribosomal protein S4